MEHPNSVSQRGPFARVAHIVFLVVCLTVNAAVNAQVETIPLTRQLAHELAERNNSALKQAQTQIDAAEGQRQDARAFLFNNPTLFTEFSRRRAAGMSDREWTLGIEQPLELAGQARIRRTAADSQLAETRASIESLRRELHAEVEMRFIQVLAVQARLATEQEALVLIERSASIVRSRVEAGEDTRLDGNLAQVELGRMRNQFDRLHEELIRSRSELSALLQLPVGTLPEAIGTLDATPLSYTLRDLIDSGQRRPGLQALAHRESANRSRLELELASRYPDLTIGLMTAREGSGEFRETIGGLTFSLPLPLFKRNATGIGQAHAELSRTRIERDAAERDIRASIEAYWQRLTNLSERLQRLDEIVLPRLDENMRLVQRSYSSGEISISELLLATRQVVDARRDILDATLEYESTRVRLEQAAGWSQVAAAR